MFCACVFFFCRFFSSSSHSQKTGRDTPTHDGSVRCFTPTCVESPLYALYESDTGRTRHRRQESLSRARGKNFGRLSDSRQIRKGVSFRSCITLSWRFYRSLSSKFSQLGLFHSDLWKMFVLSILNKYAFPFFHTFSPRFGRGCRRRARVPATFVSFKLCEILGKMSFLEKGSASWERPVRISKVYRFESQSGHPRAATPFFAATLTFSSFEYFANKSSSAIVRKGPFVSPLGKCFIRSEVGVSSKNVASSVFESRHSPSSNGRAFEKAHSDKGKGQRERTPPKDRPFISKSFGV